MTWPCATPSVLRCWRPRIAAIAVGERCGGWKFGFRRQLLDGLTRMRKIAKAALVLFAGMVGVALGLAIALRPARPEPVPAPPFRFLGNPSLSAGVATFQITNQGRAVVRCWVLSPQVKSNGQWIDLQAPTAGGAMLAPRQTSTLSTTAPSNGSLWRVPVMWSYGPTKVQLWKARAENFFRRQSKGLRAESYVAYSPELGP